KESGVPLYRLQAVASFFPHFLLTPPKKVVLRVCRDLSCHLAGSGKMRSELDALTNEQVGVEGTSCLGRCDRAPAACVSVQGSEHDCFYLKRAAVELKEIAQDWLRGEARPADHDIDQPFSPAPVTMDPYAGKSPEYAGVMRALQIRDAALARAANLLSEKFDWPPDDIARFRTGALQTKFEGALPEQVEEALRCWHTEYD